MFTMDFIIEMLGIIGDLLTILMSVAFITLIERKSLAAVQLRKGPNTVGFLGIGQPFADAFKLILKETLYILAANTGFFFFSPIFIFILTLILWAFLPLTDSPIE